MNSIFLIFIQNNSNMSELSENLRNYIVDTDVENIQINELSRTARSVIYNIQTEMCNLPLLKTTDVTVNNLYSSPWSVSINFNNQKELKCIQQIESFIVSVVEKHSQKLLGDVFTFKELYDENVFKPSLVNDEFLKCFSLNKDNFHVSNSPCFHVYDPNKCTISSERVIQDVICRCAIKPWYLQVYTKTRRFQVLWVIQQCMIMEEPLNMNCVLDADDDELEVILENET